jgi:hypothetical protein
LFFNDRQSIQIVKSAPPVQITHPSVRSEEGLGARPCPEGCRVSSHVHFGLGLGLLAAGREEWIEIDKVDALVVNAIAQDAQIVAVVEPVRRRVVILKVFARLILDRAPFR